MHSNPIRQYDTSPTPSGSSSTIAIRAHDLPVEILEKVFMECRSDILWENSPSDITRWVNFTHVCQHWRDIALNLPHLWSNINDNIGPHWLEVVIQRSKGAPIFVRGRHDLKPPSQLLVACLRQTNRLERVEISFTKSVNPLPQMTSSAPILTTLRLDYPNGLLGSLPSDFLDGDAPRLRKLYLGQLQMPWTSPLLPKLTTLEWYLRSNDCPPPDQFFDALTQMTSLRTLFLAYPMPDLSSLPPNREIALPHLERLTLAGTCRPIGSILNRLRIPRSTTLKLNCSNLRTMDEHLPILNFLSTSSWLAGPVTTPPTPFPQLRNCTISGEEVMWIEAYREYRQCLSLYDPSGCFLYLSSECTPAARIPVIATLQASPNIRSLMVHSSGSIVDWVKSMANAPRLERIVIPHEYSSDFLQVLQMDPAFQDQPTTGPPAARPIYFNRLETITVKADVHLGMRPLPPTPVKYWADVLVARSKLGANHIQLVLTGPFEHTSDPKRLRDSLQGVAHVVDWAAIDRDPNPYFLCHKQQCDHCT